MGTEWRTDGQEGRNTLEELPQALNNPSLQSVASSPVMVLSPDPLSGYVRVLSNSYLVRF